MTFILKTNYGVIFVINANSVTEAYNKTVQEKFSSVEDAENVKLRVHTQLDPDEIYEDYLM